MSPLLVTSSSRSTPSSITGSPALRMEAFGASHPGRCRRENEDAYLVAPDAGLVAVADGMGGHAAGEVASRMAIDILTEALGNPTEAMARLAVEVRLAAAIQRANVDIFAAAGRDPARAGMGTTIVAALAHGGRLAVAHAGDSRAYLFRGRYLERLTEDHSFLNKCRQAGIDPATRPDLQPYLDALARAVGPQEIVEVETCVVQPEAGDVLLLCSDGLTCVVDDREIAAILAGASDLGVAAERLIGGANMRGGPDNVTVVLARWVA